MGDLSSHFDHSEFLCKDQCGYGQPHPRLVAVLEKLRAGTGGKSLVIVSGVRCPPRNVAVGGSPRSRHQSGEAADIPAGLVRERAAVDAGAMGIGLRDGWVTHVDVRRARRPVIWTY